MNGKIGCALVAGCFFAIAIGLDILVVTHTEYLSATVTDKQVVVSDNNSKYLIFTTNEVFENCDSYFFAKFDSSDFENRIEKNKTYRFRVSGYRIPFFSMYRNIIEVKEEKP